MQITSLNKTWATNTHMHTVTHTPNPIHSVHWPSPHFHFQPPGHLITLSTTNFLSQAERSKHEPKNPSVQQNSPARTYPSSIEDQPASSLLSPVIGRLWKADEIQLLKLSEQAPPKWTLPGKGMLSRKAQLASKSLHSSARKPMWPKALPAACPMQLTA